MRRYKKTTKGFSLVELLVVVSIFLIISGVTLFRQSKFSSDILITNTAYEIALAVREAQTYGVGSKLNANPSDRKRSFGVYFSSDASQFLLYSESPNTDGTYDSLFNAADPVKYNIVSTIVLNREQKLLDFCGVDTTASPDEVECIRSGEINRFDIAFVKPSLNAILSGRTSNGVVKHYNEAKIMIQSSLGDKCRTVVVNTVGQISVVPVAAGSTGCESL